MKVITLTETISTNGNCDLIDITDKMNNAVKQSKIKEGLINISCPGSTSAIITTEFEPRLTKDNKQMIETLIPQGIGYHHDEIDNNAHSHLRATILSCEKTLPISNGEVMIGVWQQVVFADLDIRHRTRKIIFQIMGNQF